MRRRAAIGAVPRILVVDDQPEVRLLLVTALELERYEVRQASTAQEGLAVLRDAHVSLVLTDYAMPGGTGTDMLRLAHREGLLERIPVVILTAHTNVRDLDGFNVWHKPIDVDEFLRQIRELVGTMEGRIVCMGETELSPRVELALYLTDHSIASVHARRSVETALQHFDRRQVRLSILNPRHDLAAADRDCVTLTPVLVRRAPKPKIWLIGDLRDVELLVDLIAASGLEPVTEPR
jgi:CheY-like chemotaxis protein